ncbi:MAG TPA: carboxylesterase family protein, partial [Alphaproteobacteria bacterium]
MNSKQTVLQGAATDISPVILTSTGKVAGFVDARTGQSCFFGIPYAEPPVGSLRFKPTVPKKPWSSTFDASRFGAAGPQVFDPTEGNYEEFTGEKPESQKNPWVGSEDNLTLNVWTPGVD